MLDWRERELMKKCISRILTGNIYFTFNKYQFNKTLCAKVVNLVFIPNEFKYLKSAFLKLTFHKLH